MHELERHVGATRGRAVARIAFRVLVDLLAPVHSGVQAPVDREHTAAALGVGVLGLGRAVR